MRISQTIGNEAVFVGISLLVGMLLFLAYDGLRIFRRMVPHGSLWIGVEDFLYWLCCAVVVLMMLYRENDGMVRGFALGGVALGVLCYYTVFSRHVVGCMVWLLRQAARLIAPVFHFFFRPIRKYGRKIHTFFGKQLKKLGKVVKMGLCKL